ncbi:unnamed protein product [Alternaria alternata]
MSTSIEEPAIPCWLCQYCEKVTRQLTAVIKDGVYHYFRVKHYPNTQAFIDGILERRCRLCAVLSRGIAERHGLRTVERVLEKLDEYHDKADRPLLMEMTTNSWIFSADGDPEQFRQPAKLENDSVTLSYDKGDGKSEDISYVTLRYDKRVLSSENQSEFERGVPFESLSRVAQDAATVCRGVSMRYLWIDAMCIMQGPDGDFHQEAARMEEVYANALFTICAGASADTTQPFLAYRDPLWWNQCHLIEDDSGESYGYISADYCENMDDVPGSFNLDSRGWCFQEQFLSPRSVYFGSKSVHWVCREATVCDRYPDFKGLGGSKDHYEIDRGSFKQLYKRVVSLGDDISELETGFDFWGVWMEIMQKYSSMQLRYQSDKLLALAGVASIVQRKFNARASFGLWLEVLHKELLILATDAIHPYDSQVV